MCVCSYTNSHLSRNKRIIHRHRVFFLVAQYVPAHEMILDISGSRFDAWMTTHSRRSPLGSLLRTSRGHLPRVARGPNELPHLFRGKRFRGRRSAPIFFPQEARKNFRSIWMTKEETNLSEQDSQRICIHQCPHALATRQNNRPSEREDNLLTAAK